MMVDCCVGPIKTICITYLPAGLYTALEYIIENGNDDGGDDAALWKHCGSKLAACDSSL